MGASQWESGQLVLPCREQGGPEGIPGVTGRAAAPAERTVFKLAPVRVAVTDRAILGAAARIGPPKTFRRSLGLAKTQVAGFTRDRLVRARERKSDRRVQLGRHQAPGTDKGSVC